MTTLYRSPTVIIDAHEWHVTVRKKDGRIFKRYHFRPLTLRAGQWHPITAWEGRKPPALRVHFRRFDHHIEMAFESDKLRRAEVARLLGKVPMLRNHGEPQRNAA